MARILVTGASGLLGANLVLEASRHHEVIAVSRSHSIRFPGVRSVTADLTSPGAAERLVSSGRPDWVIHCAAATDVDRCESEPVWARRMNRDLAAEMAGAARAAGAAFLHISTDAVFDGESGDYREGDRPNPRSVYGATKAAGEQAVLREHPEAIVVRTNIFGWNAQPKLGLAEWFLGRCERGESSPGWTDVASTPILCNDLAERMLRLLVREARGTFHLGGATCLTKYEFGRRVAATFGFDPGLIRATRLEQASLPAWRGRDLCLVSDRAADHAIDLPELGPALDRFRRLRADGSVDRLRSMVAPHEPEFAPTAPKESKL